MAVTKIRKTSSAVLITIAILAVLTTIAFFTGGYVDPTVKNPEPRFTDLLLYLCYGVFVLSIVVLVAFAVMGFVRKFKTNPKGALTGLGTVVALVVMFGITYALGSTERLRLGTDAQKYNTDFCLKFSDMWLYSIYVMLALVLIAFVVSFISNMMSGKKG